jgi:hypothetical protein
MLSILSKFSPSSEIMSTSAKTKQPFFLLDHYTASGNMNAISRNYFAGFQNLNAAFGNHFAALPDQNAVF